MRKTVVLLGGGGFLGYNIARAFAKIGRHTPVIVDAIPPRAGSLGGVTFYEADMSNRKALSNLFYEIRPDVVVSLVSTTIPGNSNSCIQRDVMSNLLPHLDTLELLAEFPATGFVFISSGGAIYGDNDREVQDEGAPERPRSSYGIVKGTIEKYVRLHNLLRGMRYLILRPSNPFGEYHFSKNQGLINVMVDRIVSGEVVYIYGDGSIIRDYIYVQDLARAIQELIDREVWHETFNIGTGEGLSIMDIVANLRIELGAFSVVHREARDADVLRVVLDSSNLWTRLGWKPTAFHKALTATIEWRRRQKT